MRDEEDVSKSQFLRSSSASSGVGSTSKLARPHDDNNNDSILVTEQVIMDPSGQEGLYTGDLVNGLPHGQGHILYLNSNKRGVKSFEGHFETGRWSGVGKAVMENGDVYNGEFSLDQRHGQGEYYFFQTDCLYRGTFQNDQRHGYGEYTWRDTGDKYIGEFQHNQRHGQGEYFFGDGSGDFYKGSFVQGQYHGYGVSQLEGRLYCGEWQNNQAHGRGVETDIATGRVIFEGCWENDAPVSGKEYFQSKSARDGAGRAPADDSIRPVVNQHLHDARRRMGTFRGMVLRGLPHGVGLMEYDDSASSIKCYQGFWENGEWHGEGRLEMRNGELYHGEFVQNRKSGKGTNHYKDGTLHDGEWLKDKPHGMGRIMYPNGDLFEGQFLDGLKEGPGKVVFADGRMFDGSYAEDLPSGSFCKYVFRDGRVYLGDFSRGEMSGHGKMVYPNGELMYEGEYVRNKPVHENLVQDPPSGFIIQDDDDPIFSVSKQDVKQGHSEDKKSISSLSPLLHLKTDKCVAVIEKELLDAQDNSGVYTGLVLGDSDIPHGVGRMVYSESRNIREGFWSHGFLEGHGRAFFGNQDYYEGEFHMSQRHGDGVYKWQDGRIFEGRYERDARHGLGRFTYPNGDVYQGDYANGQRRGHGRFSFVDGGYYDGSWGDSLYHGQGVLKEADGSYYRGRFEKGKRHGEGVVFDASTGTMTKAIWKEDELVELVANDEGISKDKNLPALLQGEECGHDYFNSSSNFRLFGESERWEQSEHSNDEEVGVAPTYSDSDVSVDKEN